MSAWKIGDVVQLKSGGPKMTVNAHGDQDYCHCVWFDTAMNQQKGSFKSDALKKAD